jgi:hypothetical protein
VPGGVLGWDPTVDQHTGLAVSDLAAIDRDRVQANSSRGSLSTAKSYVGRLQAATTTTTSSTTSTTVKKKTTPTTVKKKTTPTTKRATTTTKAGP